MNAWIDIWRLATPGHPYLQKQQVKQPLALDSLACDLLWRESLFDKWLKYLIEICVANSVFRMLESKKEAQIL